MLERAELCAVVCLLLACKFQERFFPSIPKLLEAISTPYSKEELKAAEQTFEEEVEQLLVGGPAEKEGFRHHAQRRAPMISTDTRSHALSAKVCHGLTRVRDAWQSLGQNVRRAFS